MAREEFQNQTGGGGLGSEPFIIKVTGAYFSISERYKEKGGGDALFCHWLGTTDYEPQPILTDNPAEFHPSWKLGAGWETLDGGKTATHARGQGKAKLGSNYGVLCERAVTLTAHLAGKPEDRFETVHPWESSLWVGTSWRMVEETYQSQGNDYTRLVPIEFMGFFDLSNPGTTTTAAPAAAAQPVAGGDGVRDMLMALAKGAESFQAFQSAALAIPSVVANNDLVKEVVDESKIYAQARA